MKTHRNPRSRSSFQVGSGVYTCSMCGKRTRDTGCGEAQCELCRDCFDYAGWENSHSDDDHDTTPNANCPVCRDQGLLDPKPADDPIPGFEVDANGSVVMWPSKFDREQARLIVGAVLEARRGITSGDTTKALLLLVG